MTPRPLQRPLVRRGAIVVVALLPSLAWAGGLGEYRFGMTVEQVKAVKGCGEYKPIGTGDVECPAYPLGGKTYNLSFHFAEGKLHKIQAWYAEGAPRPETEQATDNLIAFLAKTYGELASNALPPEAPVTRAALFKALDAQTGVERRKVQLRPKKSPEGTIVFASIFHDTKLGHFVFLYFDQPH